MTIEVTMSKTEALWGLIEPWLGAEGLELDDLELKGSGRGQVLRVVVDGDQGVDLDQLADLSHGISRLLDAHTDFEDPYQLEVTSPGLERNLRLPRHYQKAVGREVHVKARVSGETVVVRGHLADADETSCEVEGEDRAAHRFDYSDIVKARTVFRWERSPKPGKK
jgi:ribosome maturation factor RimP